jgi:hypothetical protein
MIKIDYDTLEAYIDYENDEYTLYRWSCNIGFGELVVGKDGRIIDDENMGEEFARKVIEKVEKGE